MARSPPRQSCSGRCSGLSRDCQSPPVVECPGRPSSIAEPHMSEFQGYAFRAVDRALTRQEMEELESVSSRAEVTPHGMSVVYNYGDFRGRPKELMTKYFDVFVYTANWGTNRVIFRI